MTHYHFETEYAHTNKIIFLSIIYINNTKKEITAILKLRQLYALVLLQKTTTTKINKNKKRNLDKNIESQGNQLA